MNLMCPFQRTKSSWPPRTTQDLDALTTRGQCRPPPHSGELRISGSRCSINGVAPTWPHSRLVPTPVSCHRAPGFLACLHNSACSKLYTAKNPVRCGNAYLLWPKSVKFLLWPVLLWPILLWPTFLVLSVLSRSSSSFSSSFFLLLLLPSFFFFFFLLLLSSFFSLLLLFLLSSSLRLLLSSSSSSSFFFFFFFFSSSSLFFFFSF